MRVGGREWSIRRAVEAALEEDVCTYDELERRANAYLRREGQRNATKSTIRKALKITDPTAWKWSRGAKE